MKMILILLVYQAGYVKNEDWSPAAFHTNSLRVRTTYYAGVIIDIHGIFRHIRAHKKPNSCPWHLICPLRSKLVFYRVPTNIDQDADLELVVNTAHSGVVAYDLPGTAGARILWGTGRGSYMRNGLAGTRPAPPRDLRVTGSRP